MSSPLWDLGADALQEKVNRKSNLLFRRRSGKPQLEVIRLTRYVGEEFEKSGQFMKKEEVKDVSELKELKQRTDDISQLYLIRQLRSWTTLDISRDLFEEFVRTHSVFAPLWKVLFAFGIKTTENEFEFPGFRCRHRSFPDAESDSCEEYELAYVARRVERHERAGQECPWSIRQTGMYQKLKIRKSESPVRSSRRSIFLTIAPSQSFEKHLSKSTEINGFRQSEESADPWSLHRIVLQESVGNWADYLAWIENQLRQLFDKVVVTDAGCDDPTASALRFGICFEDRQRLQQLEDYTIDLQVILPVVIENIQGIRQACSNICAMHCMRTSSICSCAQSLQEFDAGINETNMLINRTRLLRERAVSISKLLADLLNYEDALALKTLARDSHSETKYMHYLTERSAKDAAAVKALTVISLIYLPTTIVANFFSTQFIQTNEDGHMRISANVWLLAAVSVPLTTITLAIWILWVRCNKLTRPSLSVYSAGSDLPSAGPRHGNTESSMECGENYTERKGGFSPGNTLLGSMGSSPTSLSWGVWSRSGTGSSKRET